MKQRDSESGRYTHSLQDTLCVCGHSLGVHSAETRGGKRPCLVHLDGGSEPCACEKFRKSRR